MIPDLILNTVSFGLGLIDDNLEGLLEAMKDVPLKLSLISTARSIALCIALGVGAYETWMMMLGRRGMDVMKILRIIIISLCITYSNSLAAALRAPGDNLKLDKVIITALTTAHIILIISNTTIALVFGFLKVKSIRKNATTINNALRSINNTESIAYVSGPLYPS